MICPLSLSDRVIGINYKVRVPLKNGSLPYVWTIMVAFPLIGDGTSRLETTNNFWMALHGILSEYWEYEWLWWSFIHPIWDSGYCKSTEYCLNWCHWIRYHDLLPLIHEPVIGKLSELTYRWSVHFHNLSTGHSSIDRYLHFGVVTCIFGSFRVQP